MLKYKHYNAYYRNRLIRFINIKEIKYFCILFNI